MSYRNEQVRGWTCANTHIRKTVHILCTVTNISIKEITFDAIPEAVKVLKLLPETAGLAIALNITCIHTKIQV